MKITKIYVKKLDNSFLRAFVDIEFDNVMTIKGWRILNVDNELSLAIPSSIDKDGRKDPDTGRPKYWPNIYIHTKLEEGQAFLNYIKEKVFEEYGKNSSEQQKTDKDSGLVDNPEIPF